MASSDALDSRFNSLENIACLLKRDVLKTRYIRSLVDTGKIIEVSVKSIDTDPGDLLPGPEPQLSAIRPRPPGRELSAIRLCQERVQPLPYE
jgi:hypothetical protein